MDKAKITNHIIKVTILYYDDLSLQLQHEILSVKQQGCGRVVIPRDFKLNKSILAVCEGEVNILNKFGERILPVDQAVV